MNKPRLIDANELVQWLKKVGKWLKCLEDTKAERLQIGKIIDHIENMPTAYDIEKVVEQLEECSVNYCKEYGYAEDENVLYLPDAIEIVKGGLDESRNDSTSR